MVGPLRPRKSAPTITATARPSPEATGGHMVECGFTSPLGFWGSLISSSLMEMVVLAAMVMGVLEDADQQIAYAVMLNGRNHLVGRRAWPEWVT